MRRFNQSARIGFVVLLLGFLMRLNDSAQAQGINISLVGSHKPTQATKGFGDVWGNENGTIACLGSWTAYSTFGVGIYDISNPSAPNLVKVFNYGTSTGNQFEQGVIRNNILYIGAWGNGNGNGSGVHILSITDPTSPVPLSRITKNTAGTVTNGFNDVHTLFLERNFLYTAAHDVGTVTVKVFDVSNPANPVYVRDIVTTNTTKVHQITASKKGTNTLLYTSGWGGKDNGNLNSYGQTDIWDVSNVGSQPAQWRGRIYSGYNSHSSWPTPDGNMLVVCRETSGGEVSFYDISTPPNPSPASVTNPPPFLVISPASMGLENDIPHNPVIVGNLLFLSWYQNGLQIFDITDRTKPVRIGAYDTFPGAKTTSYEGNWGIYPNLGLNKLLVSDINSGFYILNASAVLTATNNYPPLLVQSPVSLVTDQGSTAAFSPVITGSSLKYQWRFNGGILSGATNKNLVLTNVQSSQAGNYDVVANNQITNSLGSVSTLSVTSAVASLSVTLPSGIPKITAQPNSTAVFPGQSAEFSVSATGGGPLYFQWRFKGADIPGANGNTLTVQNAQFANVGNYSVLVTNSAGSTLSSNAALALIDSPYINSVQSAAGTRSAVVTWKTTLPTDGRVDFGPESANGITGSSFTDSAISLNHSVVLSGLLPGTTYNFQAVSQSGGTNFVSAVYQFTTEQITAFGTAVILDNTNENVLFEGLWQSGNSSTDKYGSDYRFTTALPGAANSNAIYRPNLPASGNYNIEIWYPQGVNRVSGAPYVVNYFGGSQLFSVNQQINGGGWRTLGSSFPFSQGTSGSVRIQNDATSSGVVMADAVKFTYADAQDGSGSSLPPWWSYFYFDGAGNPNADSDGDGFSDSQEYILGTSPVSAEQKFSVRVFRSGSTANVIFYPYLADRQYTLLHRSDLSSVWQNIPMGAISAGANGEGVFSLSLTSATQDFYRIAVELAPEGSGFATRSAGYGTARPFIGADAEPSCGPTRIYAQ